MSETDLATAVALALGTGMRRGEVLGLRWSDVDLTTGEARITQTLQATADGVCFVPPKTHRSARTIAVPPFVLDALKQQRSRQGTRRLSRREQHGKTSTWWWTVEMALRCLHGHCPSASGR